MQHNIKTHEKFRYSKAFTIHALCVSSLLSWLCHHFRSKYQVNTFGGQIMAWMVNVATIAARYNHTHILNALFECTRCCFSYCVLSMQSSVSGSPHSADHRHVHLQRTLSGWRQTAAEGYSQQRLQKQVTVCPELSIKIQKMNWKLTDLCGETGQY